MRDPRQSLVIINSEKELEQKVWELAKFLGYRRVYWHQDIQYGTLVYRFQVNEGQLTYSEQVVIPTRIFLEKSKIPIYHLIWLELAAKMKGIKDAE